MVNINKTSTLAHILDLNPDLDERIVHPGQWILWIQIIQNNEALNGHPEGPNPILHTDRHIDPFRSLSAEAAYQSEKFVRNAANISAICNFM